MFLKLRAVINIHKAKESDLEEIVRIYNQAVKSGISTGDTRIYKTEERLEWFEKFNDNFPLIVAENGDEIFGYAYLSAFREGRSAMSKIAEVSFFVDNRHLKKGIGSLLLNELIKISHQNNKEFLIAFLLNLNPASIKLLEKFGFSEMGSLPNAINFGNYRADHLIYGLSLI